MAALLRHGARRVGGSVVQRTKAASTPRAAAEERRLLTTTEHSRPKPTDRYYVSYLIRHRKEELYDLMSAMEGTSEGNTYRNRQLLKFLSAHVKPRPDDSLWRRMRALERMKHAVRATVVVSGCTLSYLAYYSVVEAWRKGGVTETAKKQQE